MLAGVFVLAAVARLSVLFATGNPLDAASYDQSVYYAAAAALAHGRFPYHGDFTFVHPPVIALVGTPFAVLARLTNDAVGFAAENVAFALLGAVNAVLLVVVARAWGLRRGAVAGGIVYALWSAGAAAESSARLEPLGNFVFLLFLWALGRGREGATRPLVLAGVCLALVVNVKLWWCAPALVVLALAAWSARRARVATVPAAAAAVTALVLDLPFLLVAGPRMFRSIVLAQLNRPDKQWASSHHFGRLSAGQRLEQLLQAPQEVAGALGRAVAPGALVTLVVVVVVVAFVVTAALACRNRVGGIFVALLVAQLVVLLAAPIFFVYYSGYVMVAAALVIAAAAGRGPSKRAAIAPWAWVVTAALSAVITLSSLPTAPGPVDWAALRQKTAGVPCLVADSPYTLIRLHALDHSFRPGCRNVVDFQGVSYGAGPEPAAKAWVRSSTPEYRRFVGDYLTSGQAVAMSNYYVRVRLGRARVRCIDQAPLLARSGNIVVRWSTSGSRGNVPCG